MLLMSFVCHELKSGAVGESFVHSFTDGYLNPEYVLGAILGTWDTAKQTKPP